MTKGIFITVEGVEGVGKTTNITFIKALLAKEGIRFIATREPGGTPMAEELRDILLANREEKVDGLAELLTVFAARAQHFNILIKPTLEQGTWVLCDRFTDATYAYQGCGRNLGTETVLQLETLVQKGQQPDLTIYLDLDVEIGLKRAKLRGSLDRFEQENMAFFERVRQGYLDRVKAQPERFIVIDASQPLQVVQDDIAKKLAEFLAQQV